MAVPSGARGDGNALLPEDLSDILVHLPDGSFAPGAKEREKGCAASGGASVAYSTPDPRESGGVDACLKGGG